MFAILAFSALALPLVGSTSTWITLTLAALAMGMMLFIMASGLTLVFGLMDVMNLGHAAFVAIGAYAATSMVAPLQPWLVADALSLNLVALALIALVAMGVTAAVGLAFERLFIRPAQGNHLKQILITIGAMIILDQLVLVIWGANQMLLPLPESVRGSWILGEVAIERYRLIAIAVGLMVFIGLVLMLARTRIGLLIRAGVENREMVEALGHRIQRLFVTVFVAGAALAGLGGTMWGFYREQFTVGIGAEVLVQILIVVIIGGLGSVTGCFAAAILIALSTNYVSFIAPDFALVSNIVVMMAVLLWRPRGLYPLAAH
ncbi:branched-chain amino acid ABC transporter permease [Polaromonas sp. P2-4]|nr:branched-chain amino acid ABC transporter permease [Polaromonas sp. P2-4]